MTENQNIEWKVSWRDEYLKWICGFANAEGGVLHIGRNDKGDVVDVTDSKKLHLLDSGYLKRAALLLFHPDPERFVSGAFVKIGFFRTDADLLFQDKLLIWNPGRLPSDWTVERLLQKHPSRPFNPDIANAFFRAGLIESWGRGIERILEECRAAGVPDPKLRDEPDGLWVEFGISPGSVKSSVKSSVKIIALLRADPQTSASRMAEALGLSVRAVGPSSTSGFSRPCSSSPWGASRRDFDTAPLARRRSLNPIATRRL